MPSGQVRWIAALDGVVAGESTGPGAANDTDAPTAPTHVTTPDEPLQAIVYAFPVTGLRARTVAVRLVTYAIMTACPNGQLVTRLTFMSGHEGRFGRDRLAAGVETVAAAGGVWGTVTVLVELPQAASASIPDARMTVHLHLMLAGGS
jgi:hypothetical protein